MDNYNNFNAKKNDYSIIIHGGASGYTKEDIEKLRLEAGDEFPQLRNLDCLLTQYIYEFLEKADEMLKNGVSAEEVCVVVIMMLEDNELFNAGKGGMKTAGGKYQMDASIMDGNRCYGAATLVERTKNPIKLCQFLKNNFGCKMLGGKDADDWAEKQNLRMVNNPTEYYHSVVKSKINEILKRKDKPKYGTVGCVVRDINGNICAGTSTGGIYNKLDGRIGDSPIIGAGTFCSNELGGISCTGTGEMFIRNCVAFDTLNSFGRRQNDNENLGQYMKFNLDRLSTQSGGIIGIDDKGKCYSYFTSKSMVYGFVENGGMKNVGLWDVKLD